MNTGELREKTIAAGNILGPLFLYDPADKKIADLYALLTLSNVDELAYSWPFVNQDTALLLLRAMVESLSDRDGVIHEYRRLFVGPAPMPAPPWGSVYTDRDGVIFGESTLALRGWMHKNAIDFHLKENAPEDHIGIMLILMAWISTEKPDLLDDYLQHHFLTWAIHYLEEIGQFSRHAFYANLARLTIATLEGLRKEMNLSITYPRFFR